MGPFKIGIVRFPLQEYILECIESHQTFHLGSQQATES